MTTVNVRRKGAVHVTFVESDRDVKEYEIARLPDGALACACMAYVFSKATPKTCKHIEAYTTSSVVARAITDGRVGPLEKVTRNAETFTFTAKRAISFTPI